jgi:nucleoside-diphosphate-sugar epimerase
MKILISGATGFIGSHLIPLLLNGGHNVSITKRRESQFKNLDSIRDKINVINSDTYHDINLGIMNFEPDVIIHLATFYINKHDSGNIASLIDSNVTFGTYLLEAMKENGIKKILNTATRWQHIGNKRYSPANLYAATKEAFKDIMVYYEKMGIRHKTIELSDTFGYDDTRKKIMDILLSACKKNELVELTPGEQVLDLLHIDDVCQFIVSNIGIDTFFDNKTISLSGTVVKLRDLGTMIEKICGKKNLLGWGLKPYRDNEIMIPPLYYRKIQVNKKTLEEYIKNIFENWR